MAGRRQGLRRGLVLPSIERGVLTEHRCHRRAQYASTTGKGRHHYLASIGHPLVGDPLYGVSGQPLENLPGLPGDGGYFLHARFLKFHHPITGEPMNIEAALPSGFALQQ